MPHIRQPVDDTSADLLANAAQHMQITAAQTGSATSTAGTKRTSKLWAKRGAYLAAAMGATGISLAVTATVTGDVFRDPPDADPSVNQAALATTAANEALKLLPPTNEGSFLLKDGVQGSHFDTRGDTSVPLADQTGNAIPTGGRPSPLKINGKEATSFSFNLLIFEEFGPEKLDPGVQPTATDIPFPPPVTGPAPEQDPDKVERSAPNGVALEKFLGQTITPFPTHFSNTLDANPWKAEIKNFLLRDVRSPAEGRPPGEGWSHQRWNEFYPEVYFKTAQAGARVNNGLRDKKQMHGYDHRYNANGTVAAYSEFGPNGLYHRNAILPGFPGATTAGIDVRFHPNLPAQNHNSVWTFDGTMPPKLLMVRYGQPILMRHYNALPIDPSANKGFGLHTVTTHMHNGHNPAESDGVASAFFFPGQFYDYRWPIQLAGYDTVNTGATEAKAAFPCSEGETLYVNDSTATNASKSLLKQCDVSKDTTTPAGQKKNGSIKIRGDWRETMSTQWFHDHMLDYTAQNVYKGNAVMMNYYSAIDRGNEAVDDGVNLRFPSGSKLAWGNRDYDVNLVIGDKAWDKDGQLWFNVFNKNGFLGDRLLTNFVYHPYLDVRARKYRFRILNGSVSRYLSIALVKERNDVKGELAGPAGSGKSYDRVPFHMIANDGNILEHAVAFDGKTDLDGNKDALEHKGTLPQQSIAERYDIIVDFGAALKDAANLQLIKPGDKLYFVNLQEHKAPQITARRVPLADVLSGAYLPAEAKDDDGDGIADRWLKGDPAVGKFMELRVAACRAGIDPCGAADKSMDPSKYTLGKLKMVPLKLDRNLLADDIKVRNAPHRSFTFGHTGGTDEQPWTVITDNDLLGYNADTRRVSAAPRLANGPTVGGTVQKEAPYEVWKINLQGGWDHPVHIHFEEGIILRRGGKAPPAWEVGARKDVYRIGPDLQSTDSVEVALQFREFAGTFVEHCHATQHEDNAMLIRWDLERPGQQLTMPAPIPTWDGVNYVASTALPSYQKGDGVGPSFKFGK
jgi:FtsP/CotA-like multicopper oxidase with cupredoxin domain